MKRENLLGRIILVFVVTLIGYAAVYGWIEHRRAFKGPWDVTFATESGEPVIVVNQRTLAIRDLRIVFTGESAPTNGTQKLEFAQARAVPFDVPFGKCVFLDPTFLPGTVALEMFGHQIQLLPRVLTIDQVEYPWRTGETIELRKK